MALDKNIEAFIVYVISFNSNSMSINPAKKPQIALLIVKNVKILNKYLNFSNSF